MSDAAPLPDTSRVPRREGQSHGPPPVTASPTRENQALKYAVAAQKQKAEEAQAVPPPEQRVDPEVELAKPLDALPKWEPEHTFKLTNPVQRANGTVVTEVKLRAPNGLDMFEVGGLSTKTQWNPQGMTVEMDPERTKKWLSRLAVDVDMPTLYRAPARDIRAMFEWLTTELQQAGN